MSIQSKLPFFARVFRAAAPRLLPKQHPGAPGIDFSLRQACLDKKEVTEGCLRRGKSAGGGAAFRRPHLPSLRELRSGIRHRTPLKELRHQLQVVRSRRLKALRARKSGPTK